MYYLQSRWKLENRKLHYYGLRNRSDLFHQDIKLTKRQVRILETLPRELSHRELSVLGALVGKQVVPEDERKYIPRKLSEATFCAGCCANDFIIPGMEFDEKGLCPMCQTAEKAKNLKSVVPLVEEIPHSQKSRFDIALFYTGGKDSLELHPVSALPYELSGKSLAVSKQSDPGKVLEKPLQRGICAVSVSCICGDRIPARKNDRHRPVVFHKIEPAGLVKGPITPTSHPAAS